jgi:hypothetical protein
MGKRGRGGIGLVRVRGQPVPLAHLPHDIFGGPPSGDVACSGQLGLVSFCDEVLDTKDEAGLALGRSRRRRGSQGNVLCGVVGSRPRDAKAVVGVLRSHDNAGIRLVAVFNTVLEGLLCERETFSTELGEGRKRW